MKERWKFLGVKEKFGVDWYVWAGPGGTYWHQTDWYRLTVLGGGK